MDKIYITQYFKIKKNTGYNLAIIDTSKFRCFLENENKQNCFLNEGNKVAFDTFLKSNIIIFHNRWTEEYIKISKI